MALKRGPIGNHCFSFVGYELPCMHAALADGIPRASKRERMGTSKNAAETVTNALGLLPLGSSIFLPVTNCDSYGSL